MRYSCKDINGVNKKAILVTKQSEEIFLQIQDVHKTISNDFSLQGISFNLYQGQRLGIAGATGSGKSTLLKIVAGLLDPDTGAVFFHHQKVKGPAYRLVPGEPGIAYLSQHYELRNHYRMEELLAYADVLEAGAAENLFSICRIDHLLKRKTDELSGGEKQRIALARLLLTAPKLLILDEPFSNLDLIHKRILKSVLEDLQQQMKLNCIIASHDPTDILSWADTLAIFEKGSIAQMDDTNTVYRKPNSLYVASLMGNCFMLPAAEALFLNIDTQNKEQVWLRPENMKLQVSSKSGLRAQVLSSAFFGHYFEVKLVTEIGTILYCFSSTDWKVGATAYVMANKTAEPIFL